MSNSNSKNFKNCTALGIQRRKSSWWLRLLISSCLLGCVGPVWSAPVQAERLKALLKDTSKAPEVRVREAQSLLLDPAKMTPQDRAGLYGDLAIFQRWQLKDFEGALQTIEAGLPLTPESQGASPLMGMKVDLLAKTDPEQAEAYVQKHWPRVKSSSAMMWVVRPYLALLQSQGKTETITQVLGEIWNANLRSLGDYRGRQLPGEWVKVLTLLAREGEALGYARVGWMVAPFEEKELNAASTLVVKTWGATDGDGSKTEAFIKAQTDASVANPLRDVKLPVFDEKVLQEQVLQEQVSLAKTPQEKITLLILQEQWRRAALTARGLMIERPDSPEGVMQVARVMKAADGNLVRANAFIEWVKKPQGANPLLGFLDQHKDAEAPTEAVPGYNR